MGYDEFYIEASDIKAEFFCVVHQPDLLHNYCRDTLTHLSFSRDCTSEVRWQWGGSDEEKEVGSNDFNFQVISRLNPFWGLRIQICWMRDEPDRASELAVAAALRHMEMRMGGELPYNNTPHIIWGEVK